MQFNTLALQPSSNSKGIKLLTWLNPSIDSLLKWLKWLLVRGY